MMYSVRQIASLAAIAFLFVGCASGATLDDYRQRISNATELINEMLAAAATREAGEEPDEDEEEIARRLREALPATLRIELPGAAAVDASHAWLHSELDRLSEQYDATVRAVFLTEIADRLGAIEYELSLLDDDARAEASKDADKRKLAEILAREQFQKPAEASESFLERWLRAIAEWLESIFPRAGLGPSAAGSGSWIAKLVMVLIGLGLAVLVAFLLIKFGPGFSIRAGRRSGKPIGDRVIMGDVVASGETPAGLLAEAERLARQGDLRGAIRKGYVGALCELSDRRLIGLARHKTNRDYLRDIRGQRELFDQMRRLTAIFERHWYGSVPPAAEDWESFRSGFGVMAERAREAKV
jgi:hypothetical protein